MSNDISRKSLLKDDYTHKETKGDHQQRDKRFNPWKEAALEKVKKNEQSQREKILKGVKALMEMGRKHGGWIKHMSLEGVKSFLEKGGKYGGWLKHMNPEDIQTLTTMVKQDQSLLHHFCSEDLEALAQRKRAYVDRVESGKERGKELFDPWIGQRARDEHGKLVERSINLATESTPAKPLLLGKGDTYTYTGEGSSQRGEESDYSIDSSYEERSEEEIKNAKEILISNGKYRMLKYENEEILWQYEDRDTSELFNKEFETHIESEKSTRNVFYAKSYALHTQENELDMFMNGINIEKKKIVVSHNFRENSPNWDLSEIVYNQFLKLLEHHKKDISQFDITSGKIERVTNSNTKDVAKLFLKGRDPITFYPGEDGFIAFAGADTTQVIFYMLAQHQKAFKQKKVTSITVGKYPDQSDVIYIKCKIESSRFSNISGNSLLFQS